MVISMSIWVSKEALGPQECIPPTKSIPNTIFKGKKRKTLVPNFSFLFSEIFFVYFKSKVANKFLSFCVYMVHNNGIRVGKKDFHNCIFSRRKTIKQYFKCLVFCCSAFPFSCLYHCILTVFCCLRRVLDSFVMRFYMFF